MRASHRLSIRLRSGLLLGGSGARERGNATLRRQNGEPYLPASALKGALREQLTRIANGRGEGEMVERIFGSPGTPEAGSDRDRKLFLSDAKLEDAALAERFRRGFGYAERTQVAIERKSRRASHQRLFSREVIAPFGEELVFEAEVDASALEPRELRYLEAAARAVFALGAGRSGGLGFVEMKLEPAAEKRPEARVELTGAEGGELELVLRAKEPLCLGAGRFDGNLDNVHPTLDHIPASTLRGAVISAGLAARGLSGDQRGEAEFDRLFMNPETCLRFGEALPVSTSASPRPRLAPLTLRRLKHGGDEVLDVLVRGYVAAELARREIFLAATDPGRLVPARGWLGASDPERRVVTRLALDRRGARAAHGQLFSLELLERGTYFVAPVANVGPEGRAFLEDAAARGLRVGHGRGQGYGAVEIEAFRRGDGDARLGERLDEFEAAVRDALGRAAELGTRELVSDDEHFFALTLGSDFLPVEGSGFVAETALLEALDVPTAEIVHGQVRTGQRGGFATFDGRPKALSPTVEAGSVLLLRVKTPLEELVPRLEALERHGLGARREEGFGWVRFSDDLHLRWRLE